MLSLAACLCLARLTPQLAFWASPRSAPLAAKPRETGSDAFGLCTHPALPLLQRGRIQPFLPSSRILWLPPAFPCCPLHRYLHRRVPSPGKEPLCWQEAASPFHREINSEKGNSSGIKIPDSSVLLALVCEVLLFGRLETSVYCLVFLLF